MERFALLYTARWSEPVQRSEAQRLRNRFLDVLQQGVEASTTYSERTTQVAITTAIPAKPRIIPSGRRFSVPVRYECEILAGGALCRMRTEPSSLLDASQQEMEIDETRIRLPPGNGPAHPVIVQGFFLAQELG
jgi:hypothetical protein